MSGTAPRPIVAGAGLAAAAAIALATLGAAAMVGLAGWRGAGASPSDGAALFSTADLRALEFTVTQAALSALLSVGLAVPLARALSRRRFAGRGLALALLGAPFLLPVVVAALGILAVWGRAGWLSDALAALGLARLDVYGLPGVLLAHVFFNLPLATRMLLEAFAAVPAERWRLAAQLGLGPLALFRVVEAPALRAAAPRALALVFVVCATSFAAVLTLGGGPRAATLELAIYEATAYGFDLARAARLAALQFAVCAAGALAAFALGAARAQGSGAKTAIARQDGRGRLARAQDGAILLAAAAFLGAPLLAVVLEGLPGLVALAADPSGRPQTALAAAAVRSVGVAVASSLLALALALPLAALAAACARLGRPARARAVELTALLPLAASPFVLGVAAILAFRGVADPTRLALPMTALANALAAAPFVAALLAPPLIAAHAARGRLADSLGLAGLARARILYAPTLRAPLGLAAGLAAALSVGDLGVIALFAAPDAPTLPLYMHQLAGGRRLELAHGAGLILVALAVLLFAACDALGRGRPRRAAR